MTKTINNKYKFWHSLEHRMWSLEDLDTEEEYEGHFRIDFTTGEVKISWDCDGPESWEELEDLIINELIVLVR